MADCGQIKNWEPVISIMAGIVIVASLFGGYGKEDNVCWYESLLLGPIWMFHYFWARCCSLLRRSYCVP